MDRKEESPVKLAGNKEIEGPFSGEMRAVGSELSDYVSKPSSDKPKSNVKKGNKASRRIVAIALTGLVVASGFLIQKGIEYDKKINPSTGIGMLADSGDIKDTRTPEERFYGNISVGSTYDFPEGMLVYKSSSDEVAALKNEKEITQGIVDKIALLNWGVSGGNYSIFEVYSLDNEGNVISRNNNEIISNGDAASLLKGNGFRPGNVAGIRAHIKDLGWIDADKNNFQSTYSASIEPDSYTLEVENTDKSL